MSDKLKDKISLKEQEKQLLSDRTVTIMSSLISIVVGLLMGLILLVLLEVVKTNSNLTTPFIVMKDFFAYSFQDTNRIFYIFYNAAPLMLCGLSVGFAFKAGLFNIGATGQFTLGAFFSLVAAILWSFPWWAALIVGIIAGALWGFIPGLFKALFNINEVITTIMLNWAGLFFVSLLFYNMPRISTIISNKTDPIGFTNPNGLLPDLGLKALLGTEYVNVGIIIAIFVAIIMYVILNKTVFGYEIKACGHNKNASVYAGIKAKRTIILTMVIAGGLSGLAGGISYLAGTINYTIESSLLPMGFNGIPVALLAFSNPIGIIASSIFISYLFQGGQAFQGVYSPEMTGVILSVIIYFSAFALIVGQFIKNWKKHKGNSPKRDLEDKQKIINDSPGDKKPDKVESDIKEVTE